MIPVPAAEDSWFCPKKSVAWVEVTIETTLFETLSAISAVAAEYHLPGIGSRDDGADLKTLKIQVNDEFF